MADARWLDPDGCARHIRVPVGQLRRLVREGRIPAPSYQLGPRQPRWDRLALDSQMEGGTASDATEEAVQNLVEDILAGKKTHRHAHARGRNG